MARGKGGRRRRVRNKCSCRSAYMVKVLRAERRAPPRQSVPTIPPRQMPLPAEGEGGEPEEVSRHSSSEEGGEAAAEAKQKHRRHAAASVRPPASSEARNAHASRRGATGVGVW